MEGLNDSHSSIVDMIDNAPQQKVRPKATYKIQFEDKIDEVVHCIAGIRCQKTRCEKATRR